MLDKVILTTGGTGGHIFPALAVAEELKSRCPGTRILFMGSLGGPEGNLARKAGLEFKGLATRGFYGRGVKAAGSALAMLRGVRQAKKIIRDFQPDVVIGFGGYAAASGVFAALRCKVPTMIHEQNSMPGAANRLLGRWVDTVCLSFPGAASHFKKSKSVLTGNPVRKNICELGANLAQAHPRGQRPGSLRLLVLGGSQGATAINRAVLEDLPALLGMGVDVWIQCGQRDYERVCAQLSHYPPERVRADAFIDDMNSAYAWADLAICRAGATTLAEVAVAGMPCILVPYPHATHDHQLHNARQAQKFGAALLVEQKDIVPGSLARLVENLMQGNGKLRAMSCAALLVARPGAAAAVADEAERVVDEAKGK